MPRRTLFTANERASLLSFPSEAQDYIKHYTFSEADLSVIRQHRGDHNRLGFAVQLCYLRHPGISLPVEGEPPAELIASIEKQLQLKKNSWDRYS